MPVLNRIAAFADDMTAWRRHLHAHPELGFDCHATADFVAARLRRNLVTAARPLEARVTAGLWRYTVAQGVLAWGVIHLFPRLA